MVTQPLSGKPGFFFLSHSTSDCQARCRTEAAAVKSAMENTALWWCGEFLADSGMWRKSIWIMLVHNKKMIAVEKQKCWGFSKDCKSAVPEAGELFYSFFSSHSEVRNLSLQTLRQLASLIYMQTEPCIPILSVFRCNVCTVVPHLVFPSEISFASVFHWGKPKSKKASPLFWVAWKDNRAS